MKPSRLPVTVRLRTWIWPGLAFLSLVLEILSPSRTWLTLVILTGGTWLVCFLWSLSLSRHLTLERLMRYGWAQVGDVLEEQFIVTNKSPLPGVWLEVDDHSNLPGYIGGRVTSIGSGESLNWRTNGSCSRRGLFTLGPTSLRSGDPLGFCHFEIKYPNSTVLLVLPPVLPLPNIEIAAGGQAGEGRRPRREALESTVSVDTIRPYNPGDPLKAIHWPTSARMDALFVRQFEHMPSSDWWICLDMDESVQLGRGDDSSC
jgi:uncharacterized protein (DUF58 family)